MWHGVTLGMLTPKEACLFSIGENPPDEKIERSDKSNRANSAERRPNSTRKFKTFAPSLPPYSLLVIYLPCGNRAAAPLVLLRRKLPRHKQPAWPDVIW